ADTGFTTTNVRRPRAFMRSSNRPGKNHQIENAPKRDRPRGEIFALDDVRRPLQLVSRLALGRIERAPVSSQLPHQQRRQLVGARGLHPVGDEGREAEVQILDTVGRHALDCVRVAELHGSGGRRGKTSRQVVEVARRPAPDRNVRDEAHALVEGIHRDEDASHHSSGLPISPIMNSSSLPFSRSHSWLTARRSENVRSSRGTSRPTSTILSPAFRARLILFRKGIFELPVMLKRRRQRPKLVPNWFTVKPRSTNSGIWLARSCTTSTRRRRDAAKPRNASSSFS